MARKMYEIAFELAGKINSSFGGMFSSANERMAQMNRNISSLKADMQELEKAQKKVAQARDLQERIADTAKSFETARAEVNRLAAELLKADKPTQELKQRFKEAESQANNLKNKLASQRAELQGLESSLSKAGVNTRNLANDNARLAVQLEKAEKAQQKLAKAQAMSNKVDKFQTGSRDAMLTATAASVPIVGSVGVGIQFDTAMAGVAKQVEGARNDVGELTAIGLEAKNRVMQASKDMMIMPDSMAKAFAMSAKSGVKGMENIDRFARMGTMMGTAFEAPAEEVTENFAKIGSAMKIDLSTKEGIDKLEALADAVNYLDDQSNASGADIIEVLKRVGGTATALLPTMSRNTLAGMSTAMLQMGETRETAGTALNALFTKVAAAPTQSKSFQEALAKVGLTGEGLQASALKDAEGTVLNLFERIGKLDEASKNNVLAELFGAEHIDTLSKISGNYDKFVEIIKMGNSEAAKGSMAKEFAIMSKTAERQLEGVKASAARSAVGMSEILLPSLLSAAQGLQSLMEKVQKFSSEHPALTKFITMGTAGFIGFGIAASAMAWAVSSAVSPFISFYGWATKVELMSKLAAGATRAWTAAQWLFNAALSMNPIGLTILAIAGLIAIGVALYKNFDSVRNIVDSLWGKFKETFPGAAQLIDTVGQKVGWLWDKLKGFLKWLTGSSGSEGGGSSGGMGDLRMHGFAAGGFTNRPAIFGEAGPEVAIPLDGSSRSLSLWARTGEMLGATSGGGTSITYAPSFIIQGGGEYTEGAVRRAAKDAQDDFGKKFGAFARQERRLSYA